MKSYPIAIDFDGTLAIHEYPKIGEELEGAIDTCKQLQRLGHKLILYTMRSGVELQQALDWCKERGLEFWGINENPNQKSWTQSPKVYAHLYIDDAALGTPLKYYKEHRPSVDWTKVKQYLELHDYIIEKTN